jgi:large subunit ribosomal protein L1
MDSLISSKPSSSKGIFMKKLSISSTMGPGIKIDVSSLKDEIKNGVTA